MTSTETSTPECVNQFFHYLLQACISKRSLSTLRSPLPPPPPPEKGSIRFILNDQNNYREKYNGDSWKLVCTWNNNTCTNFAISNKLCNEHNMQRQNEILLSTSSPLYSSISNSSHQTVNKDDHIKLNSEVHQNKTTSDRTDNTFKSEFSHFKQFSIDLDDDNDVKSETISSSSSHLNLPIDIEYIGSTPPPNELNITELLSRKIPPLTSFEEIYLGNLLMEKYPRTCSMYDAQLYLHEEAIKIVKRNYKVQMSTISSEYFYDFLLRHPRIAIHYQNWFSRCKSVLPTTARSIDTKIWTLSMIIRGTSVSDEMDTE